jgi:acetyltransferase-like isoleucine patch superfamily enzyme
MLALAMTTPTIMIHFVLRAVVGDDRACAAVSQRAARWPGVVGEYLRGAALRRVLSHVGKNVVISYGTLFSKKAAEIGDDVYIGAYCTLGNVRIGPQTLIADSVAIPSGAQQHRIDRLDQSIRDSGGEFRIVHVGCDCWIGSGSIVLADVGSHCVVAAGSVVTKPVADYAIVAGSPARVIGDRRTLDAACSHE